MKKIIALLLALCMLCACTIVLAAESKTTGGGTVVTDDTETTEEPAASLAEAPAEVLAQFEALGEDESPLSVFSEETQEAARAINANADKMELVELNGIAVDADKYEGGAMEAVLDYDEDFNQFNDALIIVSANGNELAVEPEVTETGDLKVAIPEEFVQNILADDNAFLAVLADNGTEEPNVINLAAASDEIAAKFQGEGASVLAPFADATADAARALYANADNMNLVELSAISINSDLYAGGPLSVALDYEEDFNQFNKVLTILSANNNELVVEPEITEEGDLQIELSEEFVQDIIADSNAFIAVLAD